MSLLLSVEKERVLPKAALDHGGGLGKDKGEGRKN